MAQPVIFPAITRARRAISRSAYWMFGIGVALLGCGAGTAAVVFATGRAAALPVALAGGIACAGLAGLIAGVITLGRVRQAIHIEVTPYRLIWREGPRSAVLEYDEVVRVDFVRDAKTARGGAVLEYPVIRFVEEDGEAMEFEVTFEDRGFTHQALFDARGIASAVLPHLPQHVIVSPALDEFLQTGEVDVDLLPQR